MPDSDSPILVTTLVALLCKLLLLACKERVYGRVELITALQEIQFKDEEVAHDGSTELADERSSGGCRATCTQH